MVYDPPEDLKVGSSVFFHVVVFPCLAGDVVEFDAYDTGWNKGVVVFISYEVCGGPADSPNPKAAYDDNRTSPKSVCNCCSATMLVVSLSSLAFRESPQESYPKGPRKASPGNPGWTRSP